MLETLADGTAALVQWKLHTGRTHQIRVHAQHMGHSLLGDDDYGGVGPALAKVCRGCANRCALKANLVHRSKTTATCVMHATQVRSP